MNGSGKALGLVLAGLAIGGSASAVDAGRRAVSLPSGMTKEQAAAIGIKLPDDPKDIVSDIKPPPPPPPPPLTEGHPALDVVSDESAETDAQGGGTTTQESGVGKTNTETKDQKDRAKEADEREDGPLIMRPWDGPDIVPDQVLFFADKPADALRAIARRNGLTVLDMTPVEPLEVVMVTARVPAGLTPQQAAEQIQRSANIAWAQPNHIYWLLGNSREQGFAMHGVRAPSGGSVKGRIVMIDSPVDKGNPSLSGARVSQKIFGRTTAPAAHGTAIAEILVGTGDFAGVAQGAELHSLAAFSKDKDGKWFGHTPDLVKALKRAVTFRPNVANLSFATYGNDRAVRDMINQLDQSGTCIAAAAGNDPARGVLFPGRLDTTLAVTAVDDRRGIYQYASRGEKVDIAALGVGMNAAVPGGRRTVSGTSFATAVVAGSMLRMPACNGGWSPASMREAIRADALDLGDSGKDTTFGAGLFTLGAASLSKVATPAARPLAPPPRPEGTAGKWPVVPLVGCAAAGLLALLWLLWSRRRRRQAPD